MDFTRQISSWYQTLQFREAPSSDLAILDAAMAAGMSPAAVQAEILADRHVTQVVIPIIRLYQAAFDRVPDTAGMAFWVDQMAERGASLADLAWSFAESPEFQARLGMHASSPASTPLVAALYHQYLGRSADAAGLAYWVGTGLCAAGLLQAFVQCSEFQQRSAPALAIFQDALLMGGEPTGSLFDLVAAPIEVPPSSSPPVTDSSTGSPPSEVVPSGPPPMQGSTDLPPAEVPPVTNPPATPAPPVIDAPSPPALDPPAIFTDPVPPTTPPDDPVFDPTPGPGTVASPNDPIVDLSPGPGSPAVDLQPPPEATLPAPSQVRIAVMDLTGSGDPLAGLALSQVNILDVTAAHGTTLNTQSLPALATLDVQAQGVVKITAGPSQAVSVVDAGGVTVRGGSSVDVSSTSSQRDALSVSDSTGAVTIHQTLNGAGDLTGGDIAVTGGTSVSITVDATQQTQGATTAIGTTTVIGSSATTSVSVVQPLNATAAVPLAGVAGVTEVHRFQFDTTCDFDSAGDVFEVAGLTFVLRLGATAEQLAEAFANLSDGATRGGSTRGNYSGVLRGWSTGPAQDGWITLTSTVPNADVPDPVLPWMDYGDYDVLQGRAGSPGVEGAAGVADGAVHITDGAYGTQQANTIHTVVERGYASGFIKSDALSSLSLSNSTGQTVSVFNTQAQALDVSVSGLGPASRLDLDCAGATYRALTITTSLVDSILAIAGAAVSQLAVAGSKALDLSGSAFNALKTVVLSGAAGVTLDASGASVTDVNASASSGTNKISLDASHSTFEGGSGSDTLLLKAGAAVTHRLSGGAGNDTLVMSAADAAAASQSHGFHANVTGFETLSLTGAAGAQTIDLAELGFSAVTCGGEASGGFLTVDGMVSCGSLTLTSDSAGFIAVSNAAWSASSNDRLSLSLEHAGGMTGGTIVAADVEHVSLSAHDTTFAAVADTATDTLRLIASSAIAFDVTGNAHLSLDVTGDVALASIDASAMTGGLTATTTGSRPMQVVGGAGSDILTAFTHAGHPELDTPDVLVGGAGNDVLVSNAAATILTGGPGNDLFKVQAPCSSLTTFTTITDAAANDRLALVSAGINTFWRAKVDLAAGAQLADFVSAAMHRGGTGAGDANILWFQSGGDTYVVEKLHPGSANDSLVPGVDLLVKLTGLTDLSAASFDAGNATLTFA